MLLLPRPPLLLLPFPLLFPPLALLLLLRPARDAGAKWATQKLAKNAEKKHTSGIKLSPQKKLKRGELPPRLGYVLFSFDRMDKSFLFEGQDVSCLGTVKQSPRPVVVSLRI